MAIAMFGANVTAGMYEIAFAGGKSLNFSDPRYWLLSLAGFAVLGFCAQPALRYFRRHYERKQTSDMVLTLDCMWLLFALFASGIQSDVQGVLRLSPVLMFVAYKTVASLCLRPVYRQAAAAPGRRLLLLRVFGHRGRTRRMLDLLGARWRYLGSIQFIAGADFGGGLCRHTSVS
jgi:hypothetical protein